MKKPPLLTVPTFVPCYQHFSFCSGSRVNRGAGHGTWSLDFTAGLGSRGRTRTDNPLINSQMLYH